MLVTTGMAQAALDLCQRIIARPAPRGNRLPTPGSACYYDFPVDDFASETQVQ